MATADDNIPGESPVSLEMDMLIRECTHALCRTVPISSTLNTIPSEGYKNFCLVHPINMAPMQEYEEWEDFWKDDEICGLCFSNSEISMSSIPFKGEPLPEAVVRQYMSWSRLVQQIEKIMSFEVPWSTEIDVSLAFTSLYELKNLLCAAPGMRLRHLNNRGSTEFPRLGPCAPLNELNSAVRNTKIIAYIEFPPINSLRPLLNEYRSCLRITDPGCTRYFDTSIHTRHALLAARVNELYTRVEMIEEEINRIVEDSESSRELRATLIEQKENLEESEQKAREAAHFHFQFVHYVNARKYNTDIDPPQTPMANWTPPGGATPRAVPADSSASDSEELEAPPSNLELDDPSVVEISVAEDLSELSISTDSPPESTSVFPAPVSSEPNSESESDPDFDSESEADPRRERPRITHRPTRFREEFDD